MKKIEIRRHALKGTGAQKDMLSPEGIEQARKVGAEQMKDKGYTHIVVSPYFRTAQTAAAMAEGAGDFTATKLIVSPALFTERMDEWVAYHKEIGAALKTDHPLVREEAVRMAHEFEAWMATLPEDAYILAVGHTPFVECLVYGHTGQVIEGLKECEGAEICDGSPRLVRTIRNR